MHSTRLVLIASLSLTSLLGCAAKAIYTVKVDSINSVDEVPAGKVIVLSGMKDVDSNDLRFKEFRAYVAKVLNQKGYTTTDDLKESEYVVFLSYLISEPRENSRVKSYSIPVYTPGENYNWNSYSSNGNSAFGNVSSAGSWHTESRVSSYSYTTYTRAIALTAFRKDDLTQKAPKANKIWETTIVSSGSSDDLRRVFPYMLTAAQKYIGSNTRGAIEVNIRDDSPEVAEIAGGMLK